MSPSCTKLAFKKKTFSFAKTLEKLGDCFERQVEAVGLFGTIPESDPDTLVKVRHREGYLTRLQEVDHPRKLWKVLTTKTMLLLQQKPMDWFLYGFYNGLRHERVNL